ncbi:MAG: hypothetical protein U0M42_01670 [Acutalibacteraceae bacterium]|nr:hypothetical protein [Acutalibacteraceae bacterium]
MLKKVSKTLSLFILAALIIASSFMFNVGAVSGKTTIAVSDTRPEVDSTVTITVRFSTDNAMTAIEGTLEFDNTKLQYVSAGGEFLSNPQEKTIKFSAIGNGKLFSETYQFKVIAAGGARIALSGKCSDGTNEYDVAASSYTLNTKDKTADTSSQQDTNTNTKAALTSLKAAAGTLTPAFDPNVTEYTVVVPFNKTDGLITGTTLDKNAKMSVEGERELKVGLNKRTLIVVASNGDTRRYTVTFNRLDENGNDTTVTQDNTDLVTVNEKEYYISQSSPDAEIPAGFSLTTAKYGEKEIAAYGDAAGKSVIVYLIAKDESEKGFFVYKDGKFSDFYYIQCGQVSYVIKQDDTAAPNGYFKTTYEHNGKNIPCYKYTAQDYADFIVISAIATSGSEGYYRYDVKESTMQRYAEFIDGIKGAEEDAVKVSAPVKLSAVALSVIFVLGIIALIVLIIVKICSRKKVDDTVVEEGYTIEMTSDSPEEE